MSRKTALVLGATGKVGTALCESLIRHDWVVHGAARCRRPQAVKRLEGLGVELIRFDVTRDDPAVLPDVDVLFLEIWDPSRPDLIWPINFYGVGAVVERYAGTAEVVNGCTINVYGAGPDPPTEDTPPRPDNEYGRSRYAQERLIDYFCHRHGRRGIHVRYAHSNSAVAGKIYRTAQAILAEESLGPDPDARCQVIGLEDFVRVTRRSVERMADPPVAVNCCHPRIWTQRELAEELHRRLGRGKVVFDRERGGVENSVYADPTRMIEWFGPPTVSIEAMMQRVVDALNT